MISSRCLRCAIVISLLVFLALSGLSVSAPGARAGTSPAERSYREIKARYNHFMGSPEQWGSRRNWERLSRDFDKLARTYPHSRKAVDALYLSGGLYLSLYNYSGRKADLDQASRRYGRLLKKYPKSRLADDALYNLGLIALKARDSRKAKALWQRLLREYPSSDMRDRARIGLKKLQRADQQVAGKRKNSRGIPRKHPRVTKKKSRATRGEVRFSQKGSRGTGKGLARVRDLRHWSSPTYTRVVIDLDRAIQFSKGILKDKRDHQKTRSIYINLKNTYLPEVNREIPINDGILRKVKVSQFNSNTVRAVIHVADIDHYKIFALNHPSRIVIDVIGAGYKKVRKRYSGTARGHKPGRPAGKSSPGTLSLARQLGLGVGTIVIDAGHGGKDSGAISPTGGQEKKVVLDIARRLKKILEQRLGCRVIMTRKDDRFIPLEERTVIANTHKADLFVSIHANASRNRRAHGIETYFLNLSTDRQAMELAAMENSTSTKNIGQLQSILHDLMQNSKIKESSRLAACVQHSLVGKMKGCYSKVKNLGVKQAPFYVLIGAQMPSILVETSFISNKMEAKRLASPTYRQKIAEGIADGIQRYIDAIKLAVR